MVRAPEGYVDDWWFERAVLVSVFLRKRGRLPTPGDGPIGAWLSSQRSTLHAGEPSMTAERQTVLDGFAPGWRVFLPAPGLPWPERAEEVIRFREVKDRWPSQIAADEDERRLGVWLSNQRSQAHRGELSNKKRAALDGYLPGWDTGSREKTWYGNADALGAFFREHDRWPSKSAVGQEERRLGYWLHNRRQDACTAAGWASERATYLDKVASGWNG